MQLTFFYDSCQSQQWLLTESIRIRRESITMQSVTTVHSPGVIEPRVLYELSEAERRTGWGKSGFRQARRNGLQVRYVGRRAFVLGSDLIAYVQEHGKTSR